jgi:hypothetical protein
MLAQKTKPLHRINGMHRFLEGQMNIEAFHQHDGLVDDERALIGR